MSFTKILIPVDGSEISFRSAFHALQFAKEQGASVILLYVQQQQPTMIGNEGTNVLSNLRHSTQNANYDSEQGKQILDHVITLAESNQVAYTISQVVSKYVADAIVQCCDDNNCDLIYIGSHGRSGLKHMLLGSVTTKVIAQAKVNVMVFPQSHKN